MQKSKNYKTRLGAIVVFATALLLGSIYYVGKNQDLFVDSFRLCAIFPDLGGLQIGDNVRFDGINIGTIDGVRIVNDSSVIVFFLIEQKYRNFVKKKSSAMITSEGLMGSKVLSILPAYMDKSTVESDDTLASSKPISVDDILTNLKYTANNTQLIAENFSHISGSMKGKKGMVGKMMNDKRFAANLDATMTNFKGAKSKMNNMSEDTPSPEAKKKKKGLHLFHKKNKDTINDSIH